MPRLIRPPTAVPPRSSILWRVVSQAVILATFIIVVLTTVSFVSSRRLLEQSAQSHLLSVASIAEDAVEKSVMSNREDASLFVSDKEALLFLDDDALPHGIEPIMDSLRALALSVGAEADVFLVFEHTDGVHLIHPTADGAASVVTLGTAAAHADPILMHVLNGEEGVVSVDGGKGQGVIAAYRYLPSLGWGLVLQVNRSAVSRDISGLAHTHGMVGVLLVGLAAMLAYLLARQLTRPIVGLADKVQALRPGHWQMERTVKSHDEVEELDDVIVRMSERLKDVYEHQEEEIAARTEELRKQYALDRAILEHIGYGVLTVDATGKISGANPAAEEILGTIKMSIAGEDVATVFRLHGHRGNPLKQEHPAHTCLKTKTPFRSPASAHINLERNDGTFLPIMFTVSPLEEGDSIFGAIIVFQDMTEERKLDYLKSDFITLASHQLRTPLSAIRWYVELFSEKEKDFDDEQRGYLTEMRQALKRMVALLTSLLHASRVEDGSFTFEIETVDIARVVREMQEDCLTMAHESGIACDIRAPSKPMNIESDPTLIRIILQNLLSNAVKYTPKQSKKQIGIIVSEKDDAVEIRVQDEGMGIPQAEQERMFEKFFRATNVRKVDTDGNGLGLHITRSIVERLGGTIHFTSVENEGTVFTVRLPKKMKGHVS